LFFLRKVGLAERSRVKKTEFEFPNPGFLLIPDMDPGCSIFLIKKLKKLKIMYLKKVAKTCYY
jgi:hypothetical protein